MKHTFNVNILQDLLEFEYAMLLLVLSKNEIKQ